MYSFISSIIPFTLLIFLCQSLCFCACVYLPVCTYQGVYAYGAFQPFLLCILIISTRFSIHFTRFLFPFLNYSSSLIFHEFLSINSNILFCSHPFKRFKLPERFSVHSFLLFLPPYLCIRVLIYICFLF